MKRTLALAALVFLLSVPSRGFAQARVQVNPTRPSASDNAYLAQAGFLEIETGFMQTEDGWSLPTLLKFALNRRLEIGFTMQGVLNRMQSGQGRTTEVGDPGLQAKVQLLDLRRGAVAVAGRVDWPAGAEPKFTAYSVVSWQTRIAQLDATVGGSLFDPGDGQYDAALAYAVAVSPKVKGRLAGFAEIFGETAAGLNSLALDAGLAFAHSSRFVSDVSVTLGLSRDAPDWIVQFGFTSTLFKVLN